MAKKEEPTTLLDEQATGEGADVQIRLTRRPPWQPSPRLPDYLLEDELNRLMDPREWKTYRALKGLMKKRYVIRILGPEAKGETRVEKARLPTKPRDGHRYLVCTYREVIEGRLKDGTPLKDIPEGGLFPEEVQVFRREEQDPLFSS